MRKHPRCAGGFLVLPQIFEIGKGKEASDHLAASDKIPVFDVKGDQHPAGGRLNCIKLALQHHDTAPADPFIDYAEDPPCQQRDHRHSQSQERQSFLSVENGKLTVQFKRRCRFEHRIPAEEISVHSLS